MDTQKDIFPTESHRYSWIVGAIVVVVLVAGAVWFAFSRGMLHKQVINPGLPVGYITKPVLAGQYPKELPKELVLYPTAEPLHGEITNKPGENTVIVTAFKTIDNPLLALNRYVSFLDKNFWTKDVENVQDSLWYARYTKGVETLEVTVIGMDDTTNNKSQVQLNYSPGKVLALAVATTTKASTGTSTPAAATSETAYDFAQDPYAGFSKTLVPQSPRTTQYWESSNQTGGFFVVTYGSIEAFATGYETQVKAAGWTVVNRSVSPQQITFLLRNTKTQQSVTVVIGEGATIKDVTVSVRIQK